MKSYIGITLALTMMSVTNAEVRRLRNTDLRQLQAPQTPQPKGNTTGLLTSGNELNGEPAPDGFNSKAEKSMSMRAAMGEAIDSKAEKVGSMPPMAAGGSMPTLEAKSEKFPDEGSMSPVDSNAKNNAGSMKMDAKAGKVDDNASMRIIEAKTEKNEGSMPPGDVDKMFAGSMPSGKSGKITAASMRTTDPKADKTVYESMSMPNGEKRSEYHIFSKASL